MKQRISSLQTVGMKFVFPVICIPLIGECFVLLSSDTGLNAPGATIILALAIAVMGVLYWDFFGLKAVSFDDHNLYVSNYLKEVVIPLSEISKLSDSKGKGAKPVTIHLKSPCEFGDEIIFMPTTKGFTFFMSHPEVRKLNPVKTPQQKVIFK